MAGADIILKNGESTPNNVRLSAFPVITQIVAGPFLFYTTLEPYNHRPTDIVLRPANAGMMQGYVTRKNAVARSSYGWVGSGVGSGVSRSSWGWVGPVSTSSAYAQPTAGAVAPVGAVPKKTGHGATATASFAGAETRQTRVSRSGGLSFLGAAVKKTTRTFAGGVMTAGGTVKQFRRTLTAALSSSGALSRQIRYQIAALLSTSGTLTKRGTRSMAATLSMSGATLKQGGKRLAGVFTSSAVITRKTGKQITAVITSSGVLTKNARHALAAILGLAGKPTKQTRRLLVAALGASGAVTRRAMKRLTAALTPTGGLSTARVIMKVLFAALATSGALTRRTRRTVSGAVTVTGLATKRTVRRLQGAVASSGALRKGAFKRVTGVLFTAGTAIKHTGHHVAGLLGVAGAAPRRTAHHLIGTLSASGAIRNRVGKVLRGTLSSAGTLRRIVGHRLAGVVGLVGRVHFPQTFQQLLTGAMALSGAVRRGTRKHFAGAVSSSGTALRRTRHLLTGQLSSSGTIRRRILKQVRGTLAQAGQIRRFVRHLELGALGLAGQAYKRTRPHPLTGAVGTSGSMRARANKRLQATLTSSGAIVQRAINVNMRGELAPRGSVFRGLAVLLKGQLELQGRALKTTRRTLAASLSFLRHTFVFRLPSNRLAELINYIADLSVRVLDDLANFIQTSTVNGTLLPLDQNVEFQPLANSVVCGYSARVEVTMGNYIIKRGDLMPPIAATLISSTPNFLNDATGVRFRWVQQDLPGAPVRVNNGVIVDRVKGIVRYDWQSGDTDNIGSYRAEWLVDYPHGTATFPNTNTLSFKIVDHL